MPIGDRSVPLRIGDERVPRLGAHAVAVLASAIPRAVDPVTGLAAREPQPPHEQLLHAGVPQLRRQSLLHGDLGQCVLGVRNLPRRGLEPRHRREHVLRIEHHGIGLRQLFGRLFEGGESIEILDSCAGRSAHRRPLSLSILPC
ncbi:hypothetical protein MTP03_29750 [Tsukamurella sp. PLM1]|nr:hypothetical protein MTP03_29750 [Tsukamurella sp. PLM1]